MIGWNIISDRRGERVCGRALPTFIHNGSHHLSTINVYADGVIDCWGCVDLNFFQREGRGLFGPRFSTQPPVGSQVGIHNLGVAAVADAEWSLERSDILAQVEQTLRELNPSMEGLVDLDGNAFESKGRGQVAKLALRSKWPYRINNGGAEIRGDEVPVFLRDGTGYRLTRWFVYADGECRIGSESAPIPIEQAIRMMEDEILSTSVPDGAWVEIDGLGRFRLRDGRWRVKRYERIRECLDLVEIANGRPGSVKACRERYREHSREPTPERLELLRQAYEAVPEHLRMYCGDMDSKDWPIRHVLYAGATEPVVRVAASDRAASLPRSG